MGKNKYEINYLPTYIKDLNKTLNYITYNLQNIKAAERLLNNINEAIDKRRFNPQSFEKYNYRKESKYTWYRIYVEHYTIFYTVTDNTIHLARILNNRRNFEDLM